MARFPGSGTVGADGSSSALTCGTVRQYLAMAARGQSPTADPALWSALTTRHVLAGSPARPELTENGTQVLRDLELRAYRSDPISLDALEAELGSGVAALTEVADNAEYFVAELGPVPPVEVLPHLRVVAASLAGRPDPPEDLVESFKNAWGSMEVLGGTDLDRLLAAELVSASGDAQESFYAPLTQAVDTLRAAGCRTPLATAGLLVLHPTIVTSPPVERWATARRAVGGDEEAAMLATLPDLSEALRRWQGWQPLLEGTEADRRRTAAYLATAEEPNDATAARVRANSAEVGGSFELPTLAAALATRHLSFEPPEVHDWLAKAMHLATSRQLAPTRAELDILGLAMLRGLRMERESSGTGAGWWTRPPSENDLPAHVALHAWLYRSALRAAGSAAPAR